jgi:hypothetical protein
MRVLHQDQAGVPLLAWSLGVSAVATLHEDALHSGPPSGIDEGSLVAGDVAGGVEVATEHHAAGENIVGGVPVTMGDEEAAAPVPPTGQGVQLVAVEVAAVAGVGGDAEGAGDGDVDGADLDNLLLN